VAHRVSPPKTKKKKTTKEATARKELEVPECETNTSEEDGERGEGDMKKNFGIMRDYPHTVCSTSRGGEA